MNMKITKGTIMLSFLIFLAIPLNAKAEQSEVIVNGNVYETDTKSDYTNGTEDTMTSSNSPIGNLIISADIDKEESKGDDKAFIVKEESIVSFSYKVDSAKIEQNNDEWSVTEDKIKNVGSIPLDDKMLKGAIILQTSLDGTKWVTDVKKTNIFVSEKELNDFYAAKDIQLINGCYYRIIVAYEMRKKVGDLKFIAWDVGDKYDYKRVTEIYDVYIESAKKTTGTTIKDSPSQDFMDFVNAGLDTGYVEKNKIEEKDPHYGWKIGFFTINGYTDKQEDDLGKTTFLKKVGDKVVLWFHLNWDIEKLNGNDQLLIAEDKNGYDEEFQIPKTNFKHGALIIKYIDSQKKEKIIGPYTDFLAANAVTSADTRVQLFEEGDYEVHLNYEILNKKGKDSYTDYQIAFKFSIKNGNAMFFPFDLSDGHEMVDRALTKVGFRVSNANSEFIKLHVLRSDIKENGDGTIKLDIRENNVARDNEEFRKQGVYEISVTNTSTETTTKKTFYVGDNKYMLAMSLKGIGVEELNELLRQGATVAEDGQVLQGTNSSTQENVASSDLINQEPSPGMMAVGTSGSSIEGQDSSGEALDKKKTIIAVAVVAAIAMVIAGVLIGRRRRKKAVGVGQIGTRDEVLGIDSKEKIIISLIDKKDTEKEKV